MKSVSVAIAAASRGFMAWKCAALSVSILCPDSYVSRVGLRTVCSSSGGTCNGMAVTQSAAIVAAARVGGTDAAQDDANGCDRLACPAHGSRCDAERP